MTDTLPKCIHVDVGLVAGGTFNWTQCYFWLYDEMKLRGLSAIDTRRRKECADEGVLLAEECV
jgi:hypothetical protein